MHRQKYLILVFMVFVINISMAQTDVEASKDPPEWLTAHMAFLSQGSGCWQASNAEYQSDEEPTDAYYNEWKTGIGGDTHLHGRLYGKTSGQVSDDYWDFLSYWDGNQGKAVMLQFGRGGVVGDGSMWSVAEGKFVQEQVFSLPDGRTWKTRHDLEEAGERFITTSLDWENDEWKRQRTYTWYRCDVK